MYNPGAVSADMPIKVVRLSIVDRGQAHF